MSKQVQILLPDTLTPSCVDWSRCCLCQSIDTKTLVCPGRNPNSKELNSGYSKIATVLDELKDFNHTLPSGLQIDSLNQGEGILQTLIEKQAKWHKKCYTKYVGVNLKKLKENLEIQKKGTIEDSPSSSRATRSSVPLVPTMEELCFLCGKPKHWNEILHCIATTNVIEHIMCCAQSLQDSKLLAILSAGDLVAQEAKYHKTCLTHLYNKCRKNEPQSDTGTSICEGMAFAELIGFMKQKMENERIDYVFKVPDLIHMYQERLSELVEQPIAALSVPHSTRFRVKILACLPDLKEIKSGREYVLVRETANICYEFQQQDFDGDALTFKRFIRNVRKTMKENPVKFDGKLTKPGTNVPQALLAVINTILYGSSVQTFGRHTKPAITICEMIMYNAKSKPPTNQNIRYSSNSETSIPLYIGLHIYSQFRAKGLIDRLHELGISISSQRVMEITSTYSRLVTRRCEEEKVLCPANLRSGLFTVAAIDNVDHNPSSTTSTGSFHGTSLSLYQLTTSQNTGQERTQSITYKDVEISGDRSVPILPDSYALVNDYTLSSKQPSVPLGSENLTNDVICSESSETWKDETQWLEHVQKKIADRELDDNDISWAAFHSKKVQNIPVCPSIGALLPLFHEHAATASMIHHGMSTVKNITAHINSGQVPIMCADQPLYTLGKLIQWNCPEQFGEDKFVLLFGPFHIEQNFLRVLGQFLTGSGWVGLVASSGIIEKGSAEAILKVVHVTKARAIHQVTAAVLHSLLKEAFETDKRNEQQSIENWLQEVTTTSPTAMYWLKVLNLEVLLLSFVRAVREGNFSLYKESLKKMMPWFFAFDHSNYARWLAVHLKDMEELAEKAPSVNEEFKNNANFVIRKTGRPFSALAIDQAHEQYNADIKGSGGAIGLTQDPASLRRFTIAGPEISALLKEFQLTEFDKTQNINETHHEQKASYQKNFLNRCVTLKTCFDETGNPFLDNGTELIALDTRVVAPQAAVTNLLSAEKSGNEEYIKFVKERLVDGSKSLYEPIKKSKIRIFDQKLKKNEPIDKVNSLKVDIQLYSRLFIVARERQLDLDEFFKYENQICPPSLSVNGGLRSGTKADLAEKLEALAETEDRVPSQFDGIVFDGAAVVQMIHPKNSKTFKEYYSLDIKPNIQHLAQKLNCKRIDLVWDLYLPDSLKGQEREGRGTGIRRQVTPDGRLPPNWSDFLKNDKNKTELFEFLGRQFLDGFSDAMVVTNLGNKVSASDILCSAIAQETIPSHMEEADGRLVLHAKDMAEHGSTSVLVRSSDTDVLVLLVSYFETLKEKGLTELWLLTGTGNKRRYVAVHKLASALGPMSAALRGFHAFTGCDTTSYFNSKGKKSCFKTWMSHPQVTTAFASMSHPLETLSEDAMGQLERFTCKLYDAQTVHTSVNFVRKDMFAGKNRLVTSLPPTSAALHKHALRAAYQAGHIWGNALNLDAPIPCPSSWGWLKNSQGGWIPKWSTATPIWTELSLLEHCGCRTSCDTMRCSCRRVGLPCTLQCQFCKGGCANHSLLTIIDCEEDNCI